MTSESEESLLSRFAVKQAHERISSYIYQTPVLTSHLIDEHVTRCLQGTYDDVKRCDVLRRPGKLRLFFKCENFQKVGAFKSRGAFYNVMSIDDDVAVKGVCTHSSGSSPIQSNPTTH